MKYILLLLFLTGCSLPKTTCENKVLTVVEVGGCTSDRSGNGSCGAMLDDGTYARITEPVKGEKIYRCQTESFDGTQTSYQRAQ